MRQKADADLAAIEKKREQHQAEYEARRQERLRRGLREFQPFLKEKPVFQRTVSVITGPRLGVLVKGKLKFRLFGENLERVERFLICMRF